MFETSPKIDSDINRNRVKNTVTGVYTVKSTVKDAANLIIDALMAAYQENPSMFEPQNLAEERYTNNGEGFNDENYEVQEENEYYE